MTIKAYPFCVECKDVISGVTGCFIYDPLSYTLHKQFQALSPVFDDIVKLFAWCNQNNKSLLDRKGFGGIMDLSGF